MKTIKKNVLLLLSCFFICAISFAQIDSATIVNAVDTTSTVVGILDPNIIKGVPNSLLSAIVTSIGLFFYRLYEKNKLRKEGKLNDLSK